MILFPVSQIILRGYVISNLSITDAGIWEGMNRISSIYLSVITTAFSVYYLPRISEISNPKELHKEIIRCYKVIIPTLLLISVSVYFLRYVILWILFTPEFLPMESLFSWQLTGDFLKICSWMLAFIMVAKAKTVLYISTEIIFTILYVVISYTLVNVNGIVGLVQGYIVNYMLYFFTLSFVFKKIVFVKGHE